jgi:cell division protein FtsI (penicillin-binding protein 3)
VSGSGPSDFARVRRIAAGTLAVLGVSIVAVIFRVGQLKTAPDPRLSDLMERPDGLPTQFITSVRPQPRGTIYDRRGQVIAMDVPGYRLYVDPRFVYAEATRRARERGGSPADLSLDPYADLGVQLARRLGGSPGDWLAPVLSRVPEDLQLLRPDATRDDLKRIPAYVVLAPEMTEAQVEQMRGIRIPGVAVEERLVRVYPFGDSAATLVGTVGFDHAGLGGLEMRNDRRLDSEPGTLVRLVDNRGQTLNAPADLFRAGKSGASIQLSIDMIVQEIVERNLDEAVDAAGAGGGRAMVVDSDTGEILAMHDTIRKTGRSVVVADPMRDARPGLGRNRCVTDPFEPGSIFKPYVWAWATMLGKVRPEEILPTPANGPIVVSDGKSRRAIGDVKHYGPSSWRKVLIKSMNAGMSIVAMRMTKTEMQEAMQAFGFDRKTGCGVPGESKGIFPDRKNWSMVYTQCSVSFGQGISVTPAQLVEAFTAFCRDGTVVPLSIEKVEADALIPTRRVLPEATTLATRDAMRGVMTEGTGHRAEKIAEYEVFGKTGTADLPDPKTRRYFGDRYTSSFIAGAPFRNPKIAIIVVIDDPDKHKLGHNNYGGGAIAAPCAVEIINETLAYLGIPSDRDEGDEAKKLAAAP